MVDLILQTHYLGEPDRDGQFYSPQIYLGEPDRDGQFYSPQIYLGEPDRDGQFYSPQIYLGEPDRDGQFYSPQIYLGGLKIQNLHNFQSVANQTHAAALRAGDGTDF
jgi:hypothetical protein